MTRYIFIARVAINVIFLVIFIRTVYFYGALVEGTALLAASILIGYIVSVWVVSILLKIYDSKGSNSTVVSLAFCIVFLLSIEGGNNSWTVSIGVCLALSFYLILYDGYTILRSKAH